MTSDIIAKTEITATSLIDVFISTAGFTLNYELKCKRTTFIVLMMIYLVRVECS